MTLGGALVALRYLTILPLPQSRVAGDIGRAAGWFPVVGLALGACLALASLAADRVVPPGVGAMLLVVLWAASTGGLHLDGLADTCDGLGGGWSRERTLSIMRDARSGPYGVTAIVLVLGLKAAALASLPEGLAWRALVLAPVLGRAGPLLLVALCPAARPEGAGHALAAGARWPALVGGWPRRDGRLSIVDARGVGCADPLAMTVAWHRRWPPTFAVGSAGSPATRSARSSSDGGPRPRAGRESSTSWRSG